MLTCRSCKRKFRSKSQGCPDCNPRRKTAASGNRAKKETKPRKRTSVKPKRSPRKSRLGTSETYTDLFEGHLAEAVELEDLLRKDAIPFRTEERDTLKFRFRLHETRHIGIGAGRVIKVPTSLLAKAKALLSWETNSKKRRVSGEDDSPSMIEGAAACPSCEAEVDYEDIQCPECGLDLNLEALESDEEEYFCFSCGEACSPEAPVCPICGANFDH